MSNKIFMVKKNHLGQKRKHLAQKKEKHFLDLKKTI